MKNPKNTVQKTSEIITEAESATKKKTFKESAFYLHITKNFFIYFPLTIFLVLFVFFAIASDGVSVNSLNVKSLLTNGLMVATVATSAVFIYSLGMLDISIGSTIALATILGAQAYSKTGSFLLLMIIVLLTCVTIASLNGVMISIFKLPSFIVTLVVMNVLSALNDLLVGSFSGGGNSISINTSLIKSLDTVGFKMTCFLIVFVAAVFIFNFTKLGRQNKIQGANLLNAEQSGIKTGKNIILSFIIMGVGMAVSTLLLLTRNKAGLATNGSSYGFDIIIALVLGGMPISGGPKSSIFAGVLGAFIITELNIGMTAIGVDGMIVQLIRGIAFLIILFALNYKQRTKYLV